jgi:hypothetical protein
MDAYSPQQVFTPCLWIDERVDHRDHPEHGSVAMRVASPTISRTENVSSLKVAPLSLIARADEFIE